MAYINLASKTTVITGICVMSQQIHSRHQLPCSKLIFGVPRHKDTYFTPSYSAFPANRVPHYSRWLLLAIGPPHSSPILHALTCDGPPHSQHRRPVSLSYCLPRSPTAFLALDGIPRSPTALFTLTAFLDLLLALDLEGLTHSPTVQLFLAVAWGSPLLRQLSSLLTSTAYNSLRRSNHPPQMLMGPSSFSRPAPQPWRPRAVFGVCGGKAGHTELVSPAGDPRPS